MAGREAEDGEDDDAILLRLALDLRRGTSSLASCAHQVTEAASRRLGIDRASVWRLAEDGSKLCCIDLFDAVSERHESQPDLAVDAVPNYVEALSESRSLAVSDAAGDPRTAELATYLRMHAVGALLDAPIFLNGRCIGVVCAESRERGRTWTRGERSFCGSLADLVGLAIASEATAHAQDALRESEELYRSLVEDHGDIVLRVAPDGTVLFANRAAVELAARPLVGSTVVDAVSSREERDIFFAASRTLSEEKPTARYEHRVRVVGNQERVISWTLRGLFRNGVLRFYQAIGHDVTEERANEARLREAQRLQALAVFSGGIAHDFNNMLVPIIGFTSLYLQDRRTTGKLDQREIDDLEVVLAAAKRSQRLVSQILLFARAGHVEEPESVDVARALRDSAELVRRSLPSGVTMEIEIDGDCGHIMAQSQDLHQIVLNLATNAIQSMPAGGRIQIRASRCQGDEGPFVQVLVSDEGTGIPEHVRSRIYEPFFTTKPPGQGTGLGLSVVHGIVLRLGGSIDVASTVGEGTTFRFDLPLPPGDISDLAPPSSPPPSPGAGRRILVVDDEPAVARFAHAALEEFGYTVVSCSSANVALTELSRAGAGYALLVADVTMPILGGVELAWRLRRSAIDIPIVLCTGFDRTSARDLLHCPNVVSVLRKPFDAASIARIVGAALDGRGHRS